VITINTPEEIKKFTWVQFASIDKKTGFIRLEFSTGLTEYLLELKKMYARIDLHDLGRFKSLYALRIFEMAKSYESLAGQKGNKRNCWYFQLTVAEIRHLLGVEEGKYTLARDLRLFVVEKPCKEINEADLGLTIRAETLKGGRYITGYKFHVERTAKRVQNKKKGMDLPAPETGGNRHWTGRKKRLRGL
jgi:plasmid replication initiation protein